MSSKKNVIFIASIATLVTAVALGNFSKESILVFANGGQLPVPTSASVDTKPTKSAYVAGETFDPSGLVANIACDSNYEFKIAYNSENADKFRIPTTPLTKGQTSVQVVYLGNGEQTIDIPVAVSMYRVEGVDIYQNTEGNPIYKINGVYNKEIQSNIEQASFYLETTNVTDNNILGNALVLNSHESNELLGTFQAEMDIRGLFAINETDSAPLASRYFPHFLIPEINDSGTSSNIDLKVSTKNLTIGDDTYTVNNYATNDKQNIPTLYLTGPDMKVEYVYKDSAGKFLTAMPEDVTVGYRPLYANLEERNGRAIWSFTCEYKGFTSVHQIERSVKCYLNGYVGGTKLLFLDETKSSGNTAALWKRTEQFITIDEENSTFTYEFDITDCKKNYGANYPCYLLRLNGNNENNDEANDTKSATVTSPVSNRVSITIGDKKYSLLNDSSDKTKPNAWGCFGFSIF